MDNVKTQHKFRFNNDFFFDPMELENFFLYQVGDLYCEYDTTIEAHPHNIQLELSFITQGSGHMYATSTPTSVKKGDIYLSIRGDIHKVTSDTGDTVRFLYIAFDIKPNSSFYKMYTYFSQQYKDATKRIFRLQSTFDLMTNILSEINAEAEFSKQAIECYLSQIIIMLYRYSKNILVDYDLIEQNAKNSLVYNLTHYIDSHFIEIADLKQLTEKFAYSYEYLSKKFKLAMGKSLNDYVTEKRLSHAYFLIAKSKKSVTYVSELLGYSSISNFSRAFKNYFGISPQECHSTKPQNGTTPPRKKEEEN